MTPKRISALAGIVAVLLIVGLWFYRRADAGEAPQYRFVELSRGDLESTVSATGTLTAVKTVDVGTQVSGQVAAINADFNDRVRRGQLIARIDPTLAQQSVRDAQATIERAMAELQKAQRDYDRAKQLYDQKVVTESEYNTAQYAVAVARANVKSAEAGLQRAQRNLAFTNIYAPVDGVVIERNVDVGQTVAASLSAPTLFKIAENLGQLQILANVDESDIGRIKEGQPVRFTVQAYSDRTFSGTVRQVRLQSTNTDNVVNYTVVVDVQNPEGILLPGMTATVDFLVQKAAGVLQVPNAALRFRPTEAMIAQVRAAGGFGGDSAQARRRRAMAARRGGGEGGPFGGREGGQRPRAGAATQPGETARLWYLKPDGKLAVARVRLGITNGSATEVTPLGPSAAALKPGMKVISGTSEANASEGATSSPFGGQQQQHGPGRPGGF